MGREQEYFKRALSDFTFEAASNGAIRHLTDRGYTVGRITKMLDFPTPFERVQQVVWKHLLDTGAITLGEPSEGMGREEYTYVTDYDEYGRKSFRKVILKEGERRAVCWRESRFLEKGYGDFADFLARKCGENGEEFSYVSCDFGLHSQRDPEGFERQMELLEPQQREYITGLPWERRMAYHRLDERMRGIAARLWGAGCFWGTCYFLKTCEKIGIGQAR